MPSTRKFATLTFALAAAFAAYTQGIHINQAAAQELDPETAPGQPAPEALEAQDEAEASPIAWTFDAQLRPRFEVRDNHKFGWAPDQLTRNSIYIPPGDTLVSFSQRSRLGLGVASGDVSGYVQVQHAGEWGLFGGDALDDPVVGMHQGWLKFAPSDLWYVQAGRQELVYGDHRVLGNVDWTQNGRAWDAVRFGISPSEAFGVDVFAGRYAAGTVEYAASDSLFERDAWLTGAYFKVREVIEPALSELDLYALYDVQIDDLSDDLPNNRNVLGLGARAAGQWGVVDGVVEGMYELGSVCVAEEDTPACTDQTQDISAWFVDAELGVEVYTPAKLRLFAAYSRASGDDPETDEIEAYFQFYPTAHKWLGLMDIIGGRSNVQEVRGGLSFKAGQFAIRETVHYFSRVEPDSVPYGLEFDTTATTALSENLTLGLGHGLFVPSDGMVSYSEPDGVANWGFVQMDAKF